MVGEGQKSSGVSLCLAHLGQFEETASRNPGWEYTMCTAKASAGSTENIVCVCALAECCESPRTVFITTVPAAVGVVGTHL